MVELILSFKTILILVLEPMNLSSDIILNIKPQNENYVNPLLSFTILLESVGLNLNRLQVYNNRLKL